MAFVCLFLYVASGPGAVKDLPPRRKDRAREWKEGWKAGTDSVVRVGLWEEQVEAGVRMGI